MKKFYFKNYSTIECSPSMYSLPLATHRSIRFFHWSKQCWKSSFVRAFRSSADFRFTFSLELSAGCYIHELESVLYLVLYFGKQHWSYVTKQYNALFIKRILNIMVKLYYFLARAWFREKKFGKKRWNYFVIGLNFQNFSLINWKLK